jgi:hypothetical protein
VQRRLIFAAGIAAILLALYSCSMRASLATDREGRIVELSSVRIESSFSRLAIEMLVIGGRLAVELHWLRPEGAGATRTRVDCPAEDEVAPGAIMASA